MARRGRLLSQARGLAAALTAAVEAAAAQDLEAYEQALVPLAAADPARVSTVTGAVVRGLLEELHPGGLTGEAVGDVLRACTAPWLPDLDPTVLVVVVTGALGLLDVDDQPAELSAAAVLRSAPVLIASLLAGAPLGSRLDTALAELRRHETVEMP